MPKTVKVRVAVAVDPHGNWCGYGFNDSSLGDSKHIWLRFLENGEAVYWVTAELPIPKVQEIAGEVESA